MPDFTVAGRDESGDFFTEPVALTCKGCGASAVLTIRDDGGADYTTTLSEINSQAALHKCPPVTHWISAASETTWEISSRCCHLPLPLLLEKGDLLAGSEAAANCRPDPSPGSLERLLTRTAMR